MPTVVLPTLHADQVRAFQCKADARGGEWAKNAGGRRVVVRCGRRWGKTKYGATRCADGATKGRSLGWFAPDYKKLSEAYQDIKRILGPVIENASKIDGVIRTTTGGRVDFWTLNDQDAGRSRFYHGVVIDEGAFTTNGSIEEPESMISIWEKSIEPTLFDYQGWALVTSNTNGADPDNFLYAICNDPKWGFINFHAPTISNPLLPMRLPGEADAAHWSRRQAAIEDIRSKKHPLVFRQEYEAEFVDWSGVAFFDLDKWLVDGKPVAAPTRCDAVFAIIDSAVKGGQEHDGTGVVYFARSRYAGQPLVILDWDLISVDGALLESWLPVVLDNCERLARECGALMGSLGAFIEDKASGTVLIQQAQRRNLKARAIDSKLTALGKDERAISISGYHYRGEVKIGREAYEKTSAFKGTTRNHFVSQVTSYRIGDKDAARRSDDLADCYSYGVSLALGNQDGF